MLQELVQEKTGSTLPTVEEFRKAMEATTAAAGKKAAVELPAWQVLSGLTPARELTLTEDERRAGMRKLRAAEAEIRTELARAAADSENGSERSFLWEPVAAACRRLGISRTALSRYMKELTGMSASDLADRIRAESVKAKLRTYLVKFVEDHFGPPGSGGGELATVWKYWDLLEKNRKAPRFDRGQWANRHGFANYARMHRACLLCYGRTPQQLEYEILAEIAEYYNAAAHLERRVLRKEKPGAQGAEDRWSEAERTKPEWLARMRAECGLDNALCNFLSGAAGGAGKRK